jgi:hypothetical protein
MEWSENCAFCTRSWFGVIDAIHKKRKPDNVGEEDEFLRRS